MTINFEDILTGVRNRVRTIEDTEQRNTDNDNNAESIELQEDIDDREEDLDMSQVEQENQEQQEQFDADFIAELNASISQRVERRKREIEEQENKERVLSKVAQTEEELYDVLVEKLNYIRTEYELGGQSRTLEFRKIETAIRNKIRTTDAIYEFKDGKIFRKEVVGGFGTTYKEISPRDLVIKSKSFTGDRINNLTEILEDVKMLRPYSEVNRIEGMTGEVTIGFNRMFNFTEFCSENNLPDISIPHDSMIVKVYTKENFSTIHKIEYYSSPFSKDDINAMGVKLVKEQLLDNVPYRELKRIVDKERDVRTTSLTDKFKDKDVVLEILKTRQIGEI